MVPPLRVTVAVFFTCSLCGMSSVAPLATVTEEAEPAAEPVSEAKANAPASAP